MQEKSDSEFDDNENTYECSLAAKKEEIVRDNIKDIQVTIVFPWFHHWVENPFYAIIKQDQ